MRGGSSVARIYRLSRQLAVLLLAVAFITALFDPPAVGSIVGSGSTSYSPFNGTKEVFSHVESIAGCAHEKVIARPFWNVSSSAGGWAANVSAKSCLRSSTPLGSVNYANYSARILLTIPVRIATSGWHNITVNWTLFARDVESYVWGSCPAISLNTTGYGGQDCEVYATNQVSVVGFLKDLSNGSIYAGSTAGHWLSYVWDLNGTKCYGYTCYYVSYNTSSLLAYAASLNGAVTITPGQALSGKDRYSLALEIIGWSFAVVYGAPRGMKHSSASASLDFGSPGLGLTINWIQVT